MCVSRNAVSREKVCYILTVASHDLALYLALWLLCWSFGDLRLCGVVSVFDVVQCSLIIRRDEATNETVDEAHGLLFE